MHKPTRSFVVSIAITLFLLLIFLPAAAQAQAKASPGSLKVNNPHSAPPQKEGPPRGSIDGVVFWDASKVKGSLGCSGFAIQVGRQMQNKAMNDPRFPPTAALNLPQNFVYSKIGTTIVCSYKIGDVPLNLPLQVTFTPPTGSFSPPIATMYSTNTSIFVIPPPPIGSCPRFFPPLTLGQLQSKSWICGLQAHYVDFAITPPPMPN